MANQNEKEIKNEFDFTDFNEQELNNIEDELNSQLAKEFQDLENIDTGLKSIQNPDALGKVILDEVWTQFGNQTGLEITSETLIQQYDREHPEETKPYDKEAGDAVMQDPRYKEANKAMKEKQQSGTLKDEYTGKDIKQNDTANLDHTVSRKEIYENQRRKQAKKSTADLANMDENLNPTNESLNKSKGAKSVDEMIETRQQREKAQIEQNERAKKKIDESNMSDAEKKRAKEKLDKRLNDKLAADDKRMKKIDVTARKAINKEILKGAAKETGKKAGKDALKTMMVQALFALLKDIINGFIRFLKTSAKNFNTFLGEMKKSIHNFMNKIISFFTNGVTTVIGTIVTEIFGPIVSLFKKLASLIKQGIRSVTDAIKWLKDKKNAAKPFSIKCAEVGKIIVAGLVAAGALFGGELIEKGLIVLIPAFGAIKIPVLGSLANIIGIFLASVISGIVGAIVINLIDKLIANYQRQKLMGEKINVLNNVIEKQDRLTDIKKIQLKNKIYNTAETIRERHSETSNIMKESTENIFNNSVDMTASKNILDEMDERLKKMDDDLDSLR